MEHNTLYMFLWFHYNLKNIKSISNDFVQFSIHYKKKSNGQEVKYDLEKNLFSKLLKYFCFEYPTYL